MKRKLKAFRMNEYDHWADYSFGKAIENYREYTLDPTESCDEMIELTDSETKELKIIFPDDFDENGKPIKKTFAEVLAGMSEPGIICSTEY